MDYESLLTRSSKSLAPSMVHVSDNLPTLRVPLLCMLSAFYFTVGKLDAPKLIETLNRFIRDPTILRLSEEHGLDSRLFQQASVSFRTYCIRSSALPPELHVKLADLSAGRPWQFCGSAVTPSTVQPRCQKRKYRYLVLRNDRFNENVTWNLSF